MSPRSGTSKRWLVSGRVQGVGFRWFVLRRAQSLQLRGFVRNLPDGRVEVVASGDVGSIEALDVALRSGPTLARVNSVETSEYQHDMSDTKSFEVL